MRRQCAGFLKLFIKCLYIYYVPHEQLKIVQGKFCYQVLACELDPVESDPKKTAQTFCIPKSIKTKKQQI